MSHFGRSGSQFKVLIVLIFLVYKFEENLGHLLESLADMDITFKALKETDIGRHVNRLRKKPSNEVRRLVKQLVRKWKDLVDEWVKPRRDPPPKPSPPFHGSSYAPILLGCHRRLARHQYGQAFLDVVAAWNHKHMF